MVLNEYYKNEYLVCGKTRDNFVIENCPLQFIKLAGESLKNDENGVKSCNVKITAIDETFLEKTLNLCENDLLRSFIARDYVCSIVMIEVLKNVEEQKSYIDLLKEGVKCLLDGNFEKAKEFHSKAPFPSDISSMARRYGRIELNFFMINNSNVFVQQAVNNFISSREPYSVKLFTTNRRLPSYLDQGHNLIECPHDFMTIKIDRFLEEDEIENF